MSDLSQVLLAVADVKTSVEKAKGEMISRVGAVERTLSDRISEVERTLADRIGKNHGRLSSLEARSGSYESDIKEIKAHCNEVHPSKRARSEPPPMATVISDAGIGSKKFLETIKYVAIGGVGIGTIVYTVLHI